jgi:hypothetical protein
VWDFYNFPPATVLIGNLEVKDPRNPNWVLPQFIGQLLAQGIANEIFSFRQIHMK